MRESSFPMPGINYATGPFHQSYNDPPSSSSSSGGGKMTNSAQHYCLRWNNHMSNFATAVAQLLKSEAFTDVTIAVDEGTTIKCHKMVLAACSSYFQELFIKNPCEHPIIILSDVKFTEIQAILDYMYRGEVNVAQDQLSGLLKVASFLKVKGLVEDSEANVKPDLMDPTHSPLSELAHASAAAAAVQAAEAAVQAATNGALSNGYTSPLPHVAAPFSMPFGKSPNAMSLWPALAAGLQMPQHPISGHQPPPRGSSSSFLGGSYDSSSDISPLSRKKSLSSYMTNRDTPILRNVLGGQNDSPHSDRQDTYSNNSNGSIHDSDRRNSSEHSEPMAEDDEKPPTTPHKYGSHKEPKPEWKRYKQYTRQHIMDAMAAVSNKEMSALQAAAKFGIPSRTLYDKLKKAGILPTRGAGIQRAPRESLHTGSARFPYSSSMNGSVYGGAPTNGISESESETGGNSYASESHQQQLAAATRATPPVPALINGLSLTPSSRRASVDEMDVGASNNNAGTPSSNEDGAEDLSVGSRRSSDHSVIVPPGVLGIKEEDETSMHHEES